VASSAADASASTMTTSKSVMPLSFFMGMPFLPHANVFWQKYLFNSPFRKSMAGIEGPCRQSRKARGRRSRMAQMKPD
jgi:hypothetical protein